MAGESSPPPPSAFGAAEAVVRLERRETGRALADAGEAAAAAHAADPAALLRRVPLPVGRFRFPLHEPLEGARRREGAPLRPESS